jgi:uncharacterized protein (UPF0335 family)
MTGDRDLYHRAVAEVLEHRKASAAFLQRRLSIGYGDAARLVERMEREGLVSTPDHVGRREVFGDLSELPDYRCPYGHVIPEQRFDRKLGCIILTCPLRKRKKAPAAGRMPEPELYDEDEAHRIELERKALRGVASIPAAAPVATIAPPLLTAWPAELTIEDGEVAAAAVLAAAEARPRDPEAIKSDHLRQIVERLEALIEQKDEILAIMRDVRAFAKAIGFEPKAINAVVKMRAQDQTARMEFEAILDTYRHVLGIAGPDFAIPLPPLSVPVPAPPKRITAKERQVREALLLSAASRAVESEGAFP